MQEEARDSAAAEHRATVTLQRELSPDFCHKALRAAQLALERRDMTDAFVVARGLLALVAASPTAAAQLARHGTLLGLLEVRSRGDRASSVPVKRDSPHVRLLWSVPGLE